MGDKWSMGDNVVRAKEVAKQMRLWPHAALPRELSQLRKDYVTFGCKPRLLNSYLVS